MQFKRINDEVFFSRDKIVNVSREDIESLKKKARLNARQRARLCTHRDVNDTLHEMLIIHTKDTYVRPHKHMNKTESVNVIEGMVDMVIFDENGNISEVVRIDDYRSGRNFYYRIADPYYHTLLIRSDVLVFHEITGGPFKKSDTVFASWAPDIDDVSGGKNYMKQLSGSIDKFLASHKGARP